MVEIQQGGGGFLNGGGQPVGRIEHRASRNSGSRIRIRAQVADDVLLAGRAHHFQQGRDHGANGAKHAAHGNRIRRGAAVVVQHLEPEPPVVRNRGGPLIRRRHVDRVVLAGVHLLPLGLLHRRGGIRGTAVLLRTRAKVLGIRGGTVHKPVGLNGARGLRLLQPGGGQPAVRRVQIKRVRQILFHLALRGGAGRVLNVVVRRALVRLQAERHLGVRLHAQLVDVAVHPLVSRVHAGIEAAAADVRVALVESRRHVHLLPRLHVGHVAGRHLTRLHEVAGVWRAVHVVVILLRLEQGRGLGLAHPLRPRAVHGVQHGLLHIGVRRAPPDFGPEKRRHVVVLKIARVHGLARHGHDLAPLLVGVAELRLAAKVGAAVGHLFIHGLLVVLVRRRIRAREIGVLVGVVARLGLEHGVVVRRNRSVWHVIHGLPHVFIALRQWSRRRRGSS